MSYIKMSDREFRCSVCGKLIECTRTETIDDAVYRHYQTVHDDIFILVRQIIERLYDLEENQ